MGIFRDVAEFEAVFTAFISEVLVHPIIGPKLARSKMIVRSIY